MKALLKIISVYCLTLFLVIAANAQYVTRAPQDTTNNTTQKVITFTSTPDGLVGIQATVTKLTGTVGGIVYLQTRIDTVSTATWQTVRGTDTLTLSNVSTAQTVIWQISPHYGNGYRVVIEPTGTETAKVNVAYLRRNLK